MNNNVNTISLFSGAMGLDLGIEKAGFNVRVCVEMDKWAVRTIKANTHIPVIERDINTVTTDEILNVAGLRKEDVTLVVGGPPCQAFSTAGKQRGLADFRGNVILQYLRVVTEIRPPYFIMENVRGLLSAKLNYVPLDYMEYDSIKSVKGSVLQFITNEFKKLGYGISYALLDSANYGVPERRERVVIIGHLGERIPIPSPTHTKEGGYGTSVWNTLRDAIGDLEEREDLHYIPLRPKSVPYMKMLKEGENWRDLPPEQAREAMGKAYELTGGKTGFLRRLKFDEPSPTLVTSPTMPATLLCHPTQLRPLSIEEYARIQQFPDDWKFQGRIETVYKQIGNAVPVGLGYAVGHQVMEHILGRINKYEEAQNRIPYSRYKNTKDDEFTRLFDERRERNNNENDIIMNELIGKVEKYVRKNISQFHEARINKLKTLKLESLLKKKNPYMYKAKNINAADQLVRSIASAFMSSAEETMFGDWLEGLAIFVAGEVYGGYKSSADGIDLEMDKDGCHYVISIKSGPKWSNSSSMAKQKQNFQKAIKVYHTSGNKKPCLAIEGCCYGREHSEKDTHTKICGQEFWQFISGSNTLYTDIVEPLGADAKAKNDAYQKEYDAMVTKFIIEFASKYCDDGAIVWERILMLNSGFKYPKQNDSSDDTD
ncbi:MAG: DNA (cytosine-5-)-methyltransferase [Prevotella sp.]|nr:DNA (cytosine-5-)-methyltransferase [Prevotella sp.]